MLDLNEADQLPEAHRALQILRRDLDPDVVQHGPSNSTVGRKEFLL